MIRKIYNQTDNDCLIQDIGFCIHANDYLDVSDWDLFEILKSNDLFDLIEQKTFYLEIEEDVIVETAVEAKRCFTPVTQFFADKISLNRVESKNLPKMAECFLANILNVIFKTHIENVLLKEYLQNVFIFMGHEYQQLSFYEDVVIVNRQLELEPKGKSIVLNSYLLNDYEKLGTIENVVTTSVDNQLVIDILEGHVDDEKIIFCEPKKRFWRKYQYVYCDIEAVDGIELFFVIDNAEVPSSRVQLRNGLSRIYFEVSGVDRRKVLQYGIGLRLLKDIVPCQLKIGELIGLKKDGIANTGVVKTIIDNTPYPLKEVYICNNWFRLNDDSLLMFVSLDGGVNWRKVQHGELEKWLDVTDWEMTSFDKVTLKYTWLACDGQSAILDDVFVMYRF